MFCIIQSTNKGTFNQYFKPRDYKVKGNVFDI